VLDVQAGKIAGKMHFGQERGCARSVSRSGFYGRMKL
jgi:hypothetical protein